MMGWHKEEEGRMKIKEKRRGQGKKKREENNSCLHLIFHTDVYLPARDIFCNKRIMSSCLTSTNSCKNSDAPALRMRTSFGLCKPSYPHASEMYPCLTVFSRYFVCHGYELNVAVTSA